MITPSQILSARQAAGLSQAKAAKLIGYSLDAWIQWEKGRRGMHESLFDYFLIKTDQHPDFILFNRPVGHPVKTIIDYSRIDMYFDKNETIVNNLPID